jgi:hypothetical protein
MLTILVFKKSNGDWAYAPKDAMQVPTMRRAFFYDCKPGFPSTKDALNAIRRDRTIPRDHDIEIEGATA